MSGKEWQESIEFLEKKFGPHWEQFSIVRDYLNSTRDEESFKDLVQTAINLFNVDELEAFMKVVEALQKADRFAAQYLKMKGRRVKR